MLQLQLRRPTLWGPESKAVSAAKSDVAPSVFFFGGLAFFSAFISISRLIQAASAPAKQKTCLRHARCFFGGEALLHQEMETLKQRRVELKRQCKQAAKDQKLLAAKRQRLLKAYVGHCDFSLLA